VSKKGTFRLKLALTDHPWGTRTSGKMGAFLARRLPCRPPVATSDGVDPPECPRMQTRKGATSMAWLCRVDKAPASGAARIEWEETK